MKRKMTVVFDDGNLYSLLKIAAGEKNRTASNIVAEAVKEWLESRDDPELLHEIEAVKADWQEKKSQSLAEASAGDTYR